MSSESKNRAQGVLTRREFGRYLAGGLGLLAAGLVEGTTPSVQAAPPVRNAQTGQDSLSELIRFRSSIGNDTIDLDSAKRLLPYMADVYTSNANTSLTNADLVANTYFLHASVDQLAAYNQKQTVSQRVNPSGLLVETLGRADLIDPLITNFVADYPSFQQKIPFAGPVLSVILSPSTPFGAFVRIVPDDDYIKAGIFTDQKVVLEADQITDAISCRKATPFTQFTFNTFSRWLLYEVGKSGGIPLDSQLLDKAKSACPDGQGCNQLEGTKSGFGTTLLNNNSVEGISWGFETYSTSYLTALLLNKLGLPYSIGRRMDTLPFELSNFQKMLQQANISPEQLQDLHRNHDIVGLISRLSAGALNADSQDQLSLGYSFYEAFDNGIDKATDASQRWQAVMKPYYPQLTLPQGSVDFTTGVTNPSDYGCQNISQLFPTS